MYNKFIIIILYKLSSQMASVNFGVVIFVPESSGLWFSEVGRIHFSVHHLV